MKTKLTQSAEYKNIIAAYEKLIIKVMGNVEEAGAAIFDVYDGETLKLYNRLHKLKNGEFVDSAEDDAVNLAIKNIKKRLKKI